MLRLRHRKLHSALLLGVVAAGALGTSAIAHPNSRWQSVAAARQQIVGNPLTVTYCEANCGSNADGSLIGEFNSHKVGVISARITGMKPWRLVGGTRVYRHFEVRACARNYAAGGAKVSAHFIWHTQRPASVTTKRLDGKTITISDGGAPYAGDWGYKTAPIIRPGCPN